MSGTHRIVWNKDEGVCFIMCSGHDGNDGTVDDVAASWLFAVQEDPSVASRMRLEVPDFVSRCQVLGWLGSDGRPQGRVQVIEGAPHLKRVQIELTTRCNLRCAYCYSESGPLKSSKLELRQVVDILEEAHSLGCLYVDFTGGEFVLYREWREVLAHATRLGLAVTVHSNGTGLSEDNLTYIERSRIRRLQISFDSHIAEIHDRVRGLIGAFDKSVRAARRARELGIKLRSSLMVHRDNKNDVGDMVRWFGKNIGGPINLDRVVLAGGEKRAGMGISEREFFEAVAPHMSRQIEQGRICESPDVARKLNPIEPHCGVAQSFVYITADGEMALCPTMTSRDRPDFGGPNLSEMGLRAAWLESAYFNRFRFANCANVTTCPSGTSCRGGCRSNAYVETGKIDSPDYVACNMHKNGTHRFVDFAERYAAGNFALPHALDA